MQQKQSRVHFLDSDEQGHELIQETQVLGKRKNGKSQNRIASALSVADLFAEDRILNKLPEYAKERYEQIIPARLRLEFAKQMSKVMRWEGNSGNQIIDPEFQESDLEHVMELLDWMNEIENCYPLLWYEACGGDREVWMDLMAMLIIHDAGEITVGDIQRSDPDFNSEKGKRHKRKEAKVARLMIRKNIPEQSELLLGYYERYDKRDSDDKLVMLGHVLDKAQAAQNVGSHVLPFNLYRENFDLGKCHQFAQVAFLEYAEQFVMHISEEARKELLDFLNKNVFGKFENMDRMDLKKSQAAIRERFLEVFEGFKIYNI
jgi:hypothetical protein